jgi:hypothetical protein
VKQLKKKQRKKKNKTSEVKDTFICEVKYQMNDDEERMDCDREGVIMGDDEVEEERGMNGGTIL